MNHSFKQGNDAVEWSWVYMVTLMKYFDFHVFRQTFHTSRTIRRRVAATYFRHFLPFPTLVISGPVHTYQKKFENVNFFSVFPRLAHLHVSVFGFNRTRKLHAHIVNCCETACANILPFCSVPEKNFAEFCGEPGGKRVRH